MNERGWFIMDEMERSQSLNREALFNILLSAFAKNRGLAQEPRCVLRVSEFHPNRRSAGRLE